LALIGAAAKSDNATVASLLAKGPNINAKTENGATAVIRAAQMALFVAAYPFLPCSPPDNALSVLTLVWAPQVAPALNSAFLNCT